MGEVADDSGSKKTTPLRVFSVLRGQRKAGENSTSMVVRGVVIRRTYPHREQLLRKQLENRSAKSHPVTVLKR